MPLQRPFVVLIAICLFLVPALAQQPNTAAATATWGGFNGPPWPIHAGVYNSGSLVLQVSGAPNQLFTLVYAPAGLQAGALSMPFGVVDMNLAGGYEIVLDGLAFFGGGSLLDTFARTDVSGVSSWNFPLPPSLAGTVGSLQAVVGDPTSAAGATLTAATLLTLDPLAVYVSATTGAPGNPGTPEAPLDSLSAGIAAAASHSPPWPVFIATGTYNEAISIAGMPGLSMTGGLSPTTWTPVVGVRSVLQANGVAAVVSNSANFTASGMEFKSLSALSAGSSSIGMTLGSSNNATFMNCAFIAAAGANGANGAHGGGPAAHGANGSGGQSGISGGAGGAGGLGINAGGNGGTAPLGAIGTQGNPGSAGALGGNGGSSGTACFGTGGPGGHGTPGTNGAHGTSGGGGAGATLSVLVFSMNNGGNGFSGANGRGGGGGGSGGGTPAQSPFCTATRGGGGGGGGAGGVGALAGAGGQGGGCSFGALLASSIAVTFTNCVFQTGTGGNAGSGGNGSSQYGFGGIGGGGAGSGSAAGPGGNGGNGGNGGVGGCGGGGAGGHSYGVFKQFSTSTQTSCTFTIGSPGLGGAGGNNVAGGVGGAGLNGSSGNVN